MTLLMISRVPKCQKNGGDGRKMGRPTELEMDTSEPSVATELVEFDRISGRLSLTFGSLSGGFGRKFIKLSEFR